ncbi:MAG: NAD-dependent epimerase/dehydratase family protein [Bacteroidales bacterium]
MACLSANSGYQQNDAFRSHNPDFEDGKQLRDFIYVKDVVDGIYYLMESNPNLPFITWEPVRPRTFLDLVNNTFKAMDREPGY